MTIRMIAKVFKYSLWNDWFLSSRSESFIMVHLRKYLYSCLWVCLIKVKAGMEKIIKKLDWLYSLYISELHYIFRLQKVIKYCSNRSIFFIHWMNFSCSILKLPLPGHILLSGIITSYYYNYTIPHRPQLTTENVSLYLWQRCQMY